MTSYILTIFFDELFWNQMCSMRFYVNYDLKIFDFFLKEERNWKYSDLSTSLFSLTGSYLLISNHSFVFLSQELLTMYCEHNCTFIQQHSKSQFGRTSDHLQIFYFSLTELPLNNMFLSVELLNILRTIILSYNSIPKVSFYVACKHT